MLAFQDYHLLERLMQNGWITQKGSKDTVVSVSRKRDTLWPWVGASEYWFNFYEI